jgi:S1-C subfamily serine protease
LENFDKLQASPAPEKLSTFDWVSEKVTEIKGQAHNYLAGKNNRQIAIEGAMLVAGIAASAELHVNLSKSGKLIEEIVAGQTEIAAGRTGTEAVGGQLKTLAAETAAPAQTKEFEALVLPADDETLKFSETPFKRSRINPFKPMPFPSERESLFEGGFTLPEGVTFRAATKVPPNIIETEELPCPDDPSFDSIVAKRFNLRLDLREANSIGIMHPRFRNGSRQLAMMKSLDRNLSLYGNNESGVGVLEYERLPSIRPYFQHTDSVVQIKFSNGSRGVGTGTLISEDGLIATAAHVVPPDRIITVDTVKGQFDAEVVVRQYDEEHDRAAIQLLGVPKGLNFPVPPMTSRKLITGMRAATVGYPQGLSGKFASVGSYVQDFDYSGDISGIHPTFLLDSVMPGNSGGPIYDATGNFAVILTKLFTPQEGSRLTRFNRAIVTGDRIEDLLQLVKEKRQV